MKGKIKGDKSLPERMGEILGFGTSMFIFISIFYYISSKHSFLSKIFSTYNISYPLVLIIVTVVYIFSLTLRRLFEK